MGMFHVYVEGAKDSSPDGIRKLAQAISTRYGLPSADLQSRLAAGRFRVKANVDKVTAEAYVRALTEVGARVTIEEAFERATSDVTGRSQSTSLPPLDVRGSTTPPATVPNRASTPALGTAPRTGASSLPPANAAKPAAPAMQSGLAAAFGSRAQSEGGFDALSGSMSLASLDGADDAPAPVAAAFSPPPEAAAVKIATPAKGVPQQPLDLFAPPDAEEGEALVELASDEIEHRAKKKMSIAPATEPAPVPSTPAMRRSNPSIQPPSVPATSASELRRGRFAAGVLLSVFLGFIPAHLIASSRESSFAKIDANITQTQNAAVDDEESYRALDGFRAAKLAEKKSQKKSIAWQSMLIWAVVSAGAGYVCFRRVPWFAA